MKNPTQRASSRALAPFGASPPALGARPRHGALPGTKSIPFDYVFRFQLTGEPHHRVQDVVSISVEGIFVGLSLGYSLVADERRTARSFRPVVETAPREPVIGAVLQPTGGLPSPRALVLGTPAAEVALVDLFAAPKPPPPNGTLDASGTLVLPLPESSGRRVVEAWDKTHGLLSGPVEAQEAAEISPPGSFRVTPTIGPDPTGGRLPAAGDRKVWVYGSAPEKVDLLVLRPGDEASYRVTLRLDKGWADGHAQVDLAHALAPGDLVIARRATPGTFAITSSAYPVPRPASLSSVTLKALESGLEEVGADLSRGFRLHPRSASLLAADPPLDELSAGALDGVFLTGCSGAEDVSFLYSLDVVGTGRELQSQPVHNIAGLGIANGDRPFRPFARPVHFAPRSSIRFQVEELSGPPGTLYIVLQGYKILGSGLLAAGRRG